MPIRFLTDRPAVFIPEIKTLVITDIHLGLEYDLYKSGFWIPAQANIFLKKIDKMISETKAEKLIVLGDLKHKVPGISIREVREIPRLLEVLSSKVEKVLLMGNHDTELKKIIPPQVNAKDCRGFKIKKFGFFHGHAFPSPELIECDYLFMGHAHATVEFVDDLGFRSVQQVWIKTKLDRKKIEKRYKIKNMGKMNLIIVPAFNEMLGGGAVNKKTRKEYLASIMTGKYFDLKKPDAYLLDGTFLGKIKDIKF